MNAITPPAMACATAADAMTADEVMAALTEIARQIGPKTEFALTIMRRYGGNDVLLTAYVNGMASPGYLHFEGATFQEAIAKSRAWADTFIAERRAIVIREMALAIIDLTDQNGVVTTKALAERNFCEADIRELATAACLRASEMANLRPFVVVVT